MTADDLKTLRNELGLSLTEAARATGYHRSHYAKLESGQHEIKRARPIRLALIDYAEERAQKNPAAQG